MLVVPMSAIRPSLSNDPSPAFPYSHQTSRSLSLLIHTATNICFTSPQSRVMTLVIANLQIISDYTGFFFSNPLKSSVFFSLFQTSFFTPFFFSLVLGPSSPPPKCVFPLIIHYLKVLEGKRVHTAHFPPLDSSSVHLCSKRIISCAKNVQRCPSLAFVFLPFCTTFHGKKFIEAG